MNQATLTRILTFIISACLLSACAPKPSTEVKPYVEDALITGTEAELIYDYAYPLVLMQITQDLMFTVPFRERGYPNRFIMFNELAKPENQAVVLGNRNTLYCVGWVDLSRGPVVFEIPDMADRYYVMPLLDAWTNTFASLGSRTTGQSAQKYLLASEDWQGDIPEGFEVIKSPTSMVWITGRIQADSAEDAKVVAKLQEQYVLTSLQQYLGGEDPFASYEPNFHALQVRKPVPYSLDMSASDFFNTFFQAWQTNPPAGDDHEMIGLLAKAGITVEATKSFSSLSEDTRAQLAAALHNKQSQYLTAFYAGSEQTETWIFNRERMGTWGTEFERRAYWAMWGLGANLVEDAVYGVTQLDETLKQLHGGSTYKLSFAPGEAPPTNAFWSVTTYDNEGYLEENSVNRYSLGNNHELIYNDDGSLDMYLSYEQPEGESNWVPAPKEEFKILLRIYWPQESALNGEWNIPPLVKVEGAG